MIRTVALSVIALGALAAPAMALEVSSAPAPRSDTPHFINGSGIARLMPGTASETFRFGPSDQATAKDKTVVYELKGGKPADHVDVTDARDNPFMPQFDRPARPAR